MQKLSIIGDHKNFKEYGIATKAKALTSRIEILYSLNQAFNVDAVRANGKPQHRPIKNITTMSLFKSISNHFD